MWESILWRIKSVNLKGINCRIPGGYEFRQRGASVYQTLREATVINKEESIMLDLTFGEQVKIILSRKGMTIKELAEIIEKRTGKKMSRQNLTQRLGRDNFQEQDMRMIAEILECPFRLSILSDSEAAEAEQSVDVEKTQPTTKELVRVAKAKARKEKKAKEAERLADAIEQIPSEIENEPTEKEMTLGDYIDIHEELERQETDRLPKAVQKNEESEDEELKREESEGEEPEREETEEEPKEEMEEAQQEAPQTTLTDPETLAEIEQAILELKEMEKEVERDRINAAKARERQQQEEKKVTGWRAMFQRRSKKEKQEEVLEEERIEQEILAEPDPEPEPEEIEDDFIDYSESEEYKEPEEPKLEDIEEDTEEYEESDDEEDLSRGERNPYTGHEYETNSVRMHPKRIGYVQLYDRGDHAWTDMTEWAFLGYQERKKALLGKDYEPPIYLD